MNPLDALTISPVNMGERQNIDIRPGDTVRVWQKIQEKGKTRLQAFEGLVLARKHGAEAGATFTVRRVSNGVGVEKIFPLYSPMIDKIEIVKRSKVRRSKLYYIREKVAREIRKQMRKMSILNISTTSDIEEQSRAAEDAKRADEEAKQAEIVEQERIANEAKATEEPKIDESTTEPAEESVAENTEPKLEENKE